MHQRPVVLPFRRLVRLCLGVPPGAVLALTALVSGMPRVLAAQGGPPPAIRQTVQALVAAIEASTADGLQNFIDRRTSQALRDRATPAVLLQRLLAVRTAVDGAVNDVSLEREPDGLLLTLVGQREVVLPLEIDDTGLVIRLDAMRPAAAPPADDSLWLGLTWGSLPARFDTAARRGFSGVVLARRSGDTVLRAAYGLADPATQHRTELETVYGIGSTPIDFTITGIMLLGQRGKLGLDDSIATLLENVPADKRGITVRQLLTGRSGLPDFHDVPAEDWDPDLAWISRATAEQRILALPLLFTPGSDDRHSHAAFVLLAAIIEHVDGRSYREFVRSEILEPVGMARTGFYGETLGLAVSDFAVGPGPSRVGLPNIPPNWGPTSWLVMGSGGMFSTLDDMARYYDAIDTGQLLTGEWANWQQGPGVGAGGSDRGFFIFRTTDGLGSSILFLMNGEGRDPAIRRMTRALEGLTERR
jgi:CubicO group peptidase (beta-lactamase class C family)